MKWILDAIPKAASLDLTVKARRQRLKREIAEDRYATVALTDPVEKDVRDSAVGIVQAAERHDAREPTPTLLHNNELESPESPMPGSEESSEAVGQLDTDRAAANIISAAAKIKPSGKRGGAETSVRPRSGPAKRRRALHAC